MVCCCMHHSLQQFNRSSFKEYGAQLIECYEGVFNTTNHILIAQIKFELGTGLLEQYMDLPATENTDMKYPRVNNFFSQQTTKLFVEVCRNHLLDAIASFYMYVKCGHGDGYGHDHGDVHNDGVMVMVMVL